MAGRVSCQGNSYVATLVSKYCQKKNKRGQGGWQGKLVEKQLRGNTSIKVLSEGEQEGVRVAGRVSC